MSWIQILQLLLSFTAGTFSSFLIDYFRRRWSRTSIDVVFEGDAGIILTPDDPKDLDVMAKYIRVRVVNTGRLQYALKLKCFLTTIEKDATGEGVHWTPVFTVPLQCAWSYHGHTGHMDIPPLLWTYFDVVKTTNRMSFIETQTTWHPMLLEQALTEPGAYRFKFQVSGENLDDPYEGAITINWNGNWIDLVASGFKAQKMLRKSPWLPWPTRVRR